MNQIPTAGEFLTLHPEISHWYDESVSGMVCISSQVQQAMIKFAQLHVEAALKAASEQVNLITRHYNAKTEETTFEPCERDVYWEGHPEDQPIPDLTVEVEKESILNAYPKELIK